MAKKQLIKIASEDILINSNVTDKNRNYGRIKTSCPRSGTLFAECKANIVGKSRNGSKNRPRGFDFKTRGIRKMKQRFYMDTSVLGGLFDVEFEQETFLLFEKVKSGQVVCVYSDLTESEITNAPEKVRAFFENLVSEQKEKVRITPEVLKLAETYINEKVVGETNFDDCVHIAVATVYKVDLPVSWNFTHIVNVYRIRGYNSINLRLGYATLDIHSPKEIIEYEDEN